jgi:hypothetical protein
VRGIALLARHFPEHTRPHVRILRMFTQFGPAVLDRLYFGAGARLDCGNRRSEYPESPFRAGNNANKCLMRLPNSSPARITFL